MNCKNETFDIKEFSSFRNIAEQYSDAFIKSQKAVIAENNENELKILCAESSDCTQEFFTKIHNGKAILIEKVKDTEFSEFIGKYVEVSFESTEIQTKSEFSLEEISSDAPCVNIINAICLEAIRRNCSDIHIQNTASSVNIRFRIDGVLQTVKVLNRSVLQPLVNRIKVMSGLNVMENRLCQDGRMSVSADGKNYDFRVSVVPCVGGQSIVLRLFNIEEKALSLEELGFSPDNYKKLSNALHLSNGLILATGPTGSGKTTTLHALLSKMDRKHLKIVSIEDPVEKELEGVDQIQINDEIGLTFESTLRRILRQDPDVIMVGEIRDKETAELCVRASLTGHLVLSTLHTNDSIGSVTRLKNLGVESYLIADVLRLSLAQRLVRKVCTKCNGKGCNECSKTGFKGRTCVSEVFEADENVRNLIEKDCSEGEIKTYLKKNGFSNLFEDAKNKVKEKITTQEELFREGLYEN